MSNKETTKPVLALILLDETSSMNKNKDQTLSGFNEYIDTLKINATNTYIRLVTFSQKSLSTYKLMSGVRSTNEPLKDDNIRLIYDLKPIMEVEPLTNNIYSPNGNTNLLDAIGVSIMQLDEYLDTLSETYNILFVIITDGEENCSTKWKSNDIKSLIASREKLGWNFIYLGANQDAFTVSSSLGISGGNTKSYSVNNQTEMFRGLSAATSSYAVKASSTKSDDSLVTHSFFDESSSK